MSFFKPRIKTDEHSIREALTRGVERIYPNPEFLDGELKSGKRLRLYLGIDPTGPLHVGHLIPLLKLRQFQELGHEVIVLYGGFTAQIGDPTDKMATRTQLSRRQIKKNSENYRSLIGKILDLGKTNVRFLDNEKWTNKLKPADLIELASRFTVAQVLERDMFQERLKQSKEIYLHEFLYPVFQAYDAVTMDVDIQVGGNDQTFNMLAGRTLMRKMKAKEKSVIAMKLLVDPSSGRKMGKSEGNMVTLDDLPGNMFGKIMSWPDTMILPGFELCTIVPMSEVTALREELLAGKNPKEAKLTLAETIVGFLHGKKEAVGARAAFVSAFAEGKPEEFVHVGLLGKEVGEALIEKKIVSSKGELRRLIAEGAVTNLDTGEKMGDIFLKTAPLGRYRIGKHRFIQLT